ncbi:MAG: hypothetical protein JJT75_07435 [Opitutales bacterium]|nr:hypothetical protein [Opitutales bacterium]MCH8540952.1 hypothetical protein [Opitutales bacterium]
MQLNAEQKEAVAQWVRDGAKPANVQKRLQLDFGVAMTYMDVRFLVDDLELEWVDKKPRQDEATKHLSADQAVAAGAKEEPPAPGDSVPAADELQPVGNVQVEVNKVNRPGTLVSGQVTFSDGVKAEWGLDQMGRIMMQPEKEGYQPDQEDVQAFQQELQKTLESQGM